MASKLSVKRRAARVRRQIRAHNTERPRLSIYRSGKNIYAQVIDDKAGRTLAAASTLDKDLKGGLKHFVIGLARFDRESPETAASAHLRIVFVPDTSWARRLLRAVFSALHRRLPLRHRKPLTPTQRNREKT